MNTERTSSSASRFFASFSQKPRLFFLWLAAALVLIGLAATAVQAGLKPASHPGGTGAVLALAAQLRTARVQAAASSGHTPDGRTLASRKMMHTGALIKAQAAAAASVVPISGGVQTFDVNNPPPAFRPLIGFGSAGALNNSSTNPPVYVSALAPTNLTPVWSADETFLVFSSNRSATGGLDASATDGGPRYHLWAISVNGGQAFQITTSAGPAGGGEFFPALSRNNLTVAFVSDAVSPGTPNLYALAFSYSTLSSGAVAPTNLSPTAANPNPPASLTLRAATEAASAQLTGFDQVQRPSFSPNDDLLVFAARSVLGTFSGRTHLYFLYRSSGGFDANNNVSFPGKLTDGPADDTDPAYAPDGSYIAFSSTANAAGFIRNPNNALGPNPPSAPQDPNASQSLSGGVAAATRSIFLISGGLSTTGVPFGTVPSVLSSTGGRVTRGSAAGFDDYGPAWSSFANQNQYTNPSGNFAYLAFARSGAAAASHDIYYFQAITGVSQPSSEQIVPETASGGINAAIKLNTDDNGSGTAAANAFNDIYPTWSPFLSIFSIAYASNRTVTYNAPANGAPVEVAASVADSGTVTNSQDATASYTVGAAYSGLLVSQVLNLDPPTLLRFGANEVVHVQAAGAVDGSGSSIDPVNGNANKLAVTGGQKITLTVRLSDREAGIDDTGGPGGGPRVYVQIKDPDSKYQDAKGLEHKVFMKDRRYDQPSQTNHPANDTSSGTANGLLDIYNYVLPVSQLYGSLFNLQNGFVELPTYQKFIYPSYGTASSFPPIVGQDTVNGVFPRGTHGGQWQADATNNPNNTHLFVGKSAIGTANPLGQFTYPVKSGRASAFYPGTDPAQFIPHGPEYECQVINPNFSSGGTILDASPADYVTPYWLAGVDDQGAFSGGVYGQVGAKDRPNTEWLPLKRVADAKQDNKGGTLYTVTWNTPVSGSDFYVDVIAYDKAVFPNVPNSTYSGQKTNWRIYDNVGGFSTNQSVGSEDILVVSDYALGQKFAATTFGGRNFNLNLVPKIFGTESYLTDVDINILPDSVYAGIPSAESKGDASAGPPATPARVAFQFSPVVQPFGQETVSSLFNNGVYPGNNRAFVLTQNGLGVQSYIDTDINDGTKSTDGAPNVQSQRYSIWRILSRGPVPQSILSSYLPKPVKQPAIVDPADPTYKNLPAAQVLDASQCVIWLSPYTGDVLADPGTIDDPGNVGSAGVTNPRQSTTSILTAFVQAGGRLCVTGQDVGSTLTQGGSVGNTPSKIAGSPNFLPDVLGATLVASGSGSNVLAGTNNRITGSPFYDGTDLTTHGLYQTLTGPIQGPEVLSLPNLPYQDNLVIGDADYADGGLSQIPALQLPGGQNAQGQATGTVIQGQPDVIAASNTAQVAMTYAGAGTAMVFHDDPYLGGTAGIPAGATAGQLPNGGSGSRVVYAAFGLEALTNDYYSSASPNPSPSPINPPNPLPLNQIIPTVIPRNPRSAILHNIVSYLRTGRVSGTITQTAGSGQGGGLGIDGVTVYLRPIINTATNAPYVPTARAAFSALTANGGRFTIAGVEPGTYTLVAIKPGFQRAVSNSGVTFTVEGDVTKTGATLTLAPQQPGNIAGAVKDPAGNLISGSLVTFTSQDNSVTQSATTQNGSVTGNPAENYFLQTVPVTTYTATASSPLNPQSLPEYSSAKTPDGPGPTAKAGDPDYSKGITVQPNTTVQPVNFTLTPILASISGTVTSSVGGAGVPGATVSITDSAGKPVGTPAVTAADGTYKLTGIPAATTPTTYSLTATAPGFAASAALPETVYLGSVITGADFSLSPIAPGSIKVTVVYSTGGPVPGAVVTYTAPGGTPKTVTTGADGTVVIAAVPPATYSVTAIGPVNANGKPTTAAAPAQQVPVTSGNQTAVSFSVVPTPPSFSGTVSAAAATTGGAATPLAGAAVTVTGTDAAGTAITPVVVNTKADGTYTTGSLAPGTYTVTASKGGFTSASQGPTKVQFGDVVTGVNFTLGAVLPGSITGTVLDSLGAPVSGAVVTFNSNDGTVTGQTATTIADGSYVIPPSATAPNVPATTYTGTAVGPVNANGKAAYTKSPPVSVTVPAGGSGTANFVLPIIPASVSGTITDAQTTGPVAGATVTLTDPTGKAVGAPVTTGTDGKYAFTNVPAAQGSQSYTVTVSKAGYFAGTAAVSLALGDTAVQDIALNEQATLYGLVTDGSQNAPGSPPLAGVTITVTNSTGGVVATVPATVTTQTGTAAGPDGKPSNYSASLLPGTYTVTASKGSYDSKISAVVTVTQATPVRVDLALVSSIGTLGGLVTDQNGTAPVGGATVTATLVGGTGTAAGVTFTTVATATPGPDGAPVNYTGQLSKGTYSVTVTKGSRTTAAKSVTVVGGTFNRADFTGTTGLPALHTFAAGFQFVSTPYDYSALGFDGLFGTKNTAIAGTTPNGNRSSVAVWDPLAGAYALDPTAPADSLRLGVGYWVYLKNAVPVIQQGTTPTAATVRVSLGKGWNQIGVPNPAGVAVQNLAFDNGAGGTISFSAASGSQYNLVTYPLYSYAAGGYQAVPTAGTLTPWNAYWLYVNAPAILVIPTR